MVAEPWSDDDFDPDEDLFDFEETVQASTLDADLDDDLEELLATLQPVEAAGSPAAARRRRPAGPAAQALEDVWSWPEEGEPRRPAGSAGQRGVGIVPAWSLPTGVLVLLIAMTCVNGLVAFLALRTTADLQKRALATDLLIASAADGLREGPAELPSELTGELGSPRTSKASVAPELLAAFARARDEIDQGRYADARRSAFSLLAAVDRLDGAQRADVESLARSVLADALQLEALRRLSQARYLEWARALAVRGEADAARAVLRDLEEMR